MTFSDIFKKSFLDGFTSADINIYTAGTAMLITCALALYIFVVYRVLTKKTFYSKSFNIALAGIALITSAIILTIQSSIVVSLGMVGALSIVRFRNAVKDPADLTFLFWSISMGIIVGAGLYKLAVLLSLAATVLIMGLDLVPTFRAPCILVVSGDSGMEETELLRCVKASCPRVRVRSRNISKRGLEWILEVGVKDGGDLVSKVAAVPGVVSVNLMSHDGEVRF